MSNKIAIRSSLVLAISASAIAISAASSFAESPPEPKTFAAQGKIK